MPAMRSDFATVRFMEHLGSNPNAYAPGYSDFTFVGPRTTLLDFNVGGPLADDLGYLLIQAYGVGGTYGHRILINGEDLGGAGTAPGAPFFFRMSGYWDGTPPELRVYRGEEGFTEAVFGVWDQPEANRSVPRSAEFSIPPGGGDSVRLRLRALPGSQMMLTGWLVSGGEPRPPLPQARIP